MSKIYDTQKVLEKFNERLYKFIEENNLKELKPDLNVESFKEGYENDIDEHFKYIRVTHDSKQKIQHHTAGMLLETDERKVWWNYEMLKPLMGHDQIIIKLKERYGMNYELLMKRYKSYNGQINKVKYILDRQDAVSVNTKAWWILYKDYLIEVDKINLIDDTLWDLIIYISEITNVGSYSIPNEIMNTMQKQIKKPEYKEQRDDVNQNREGRI